MLRRTVELYEGGDFTDAYLIATAGAESISAIVSFDHGIRNVPPIRRTKP